MRQAAPLYQERVLAARWFAAVARVVFVAPLFGIAATIRDSALDSGSRAAIVAGLFVVSSVLLAVGFWFTALEITVSGGGLRFRFGPFGRTLGVSDVREVRAVPYSALAFGGWGWRFGRQGGRTVQAYTVPFLRTGVEVTTDAGRTYYVSSRNPSALSAALVRMTGREGAA